jgi:hypothetical protein
MVARVPHSPHQNHLLDALPTTEYEHVTAHADLVPMQLGHVLNDRA